MTTRSRRLLFIALALAVPLAGCGRKAPSATLSASAIAPAAAAPAAALPAVGTGRAAPSVAIVKTSADADPVPAELIVRFREQVRDVPGTTVKAKLDLPNTYLYKVDKSLMSLKAVADLADQDDIDYVEPNYTYHAVAATNDPEYLAGWGTEAINAPSLWAFSMGTNVKVAVLDTGVAMNQPDLNGQIVPGADLVNNDGDASDDHGHGTHVAGIIAALANNGYGTAGVAPGCKIIPIKVLDKDGGGQNATIANGVLEASRLGAQIINLSLGGTDNSETLRRAIAQVQAQGRIVIAAAGNEGVSTPFYPAANDGVLAVGSVDSSRRRSSFSNYGDYVDIAAPGSNITSSAMGGGTKSMSGTSMASPHVAGAAALLLSLHPRLRAGHLTHLFRDSGHATTGFNNDMRAIDVEAALVQVPNLDMTPPTAVYGVAARPGAPGEVQLSWNPSSDNRGRVAYRIVRDGQDMGSTSNTTFTDMGVKGTATYTIIAHDPDGNDAAPSAAVSSQPGTPSALITDIKITDRAKDHFTITWNTAVPLRCYVQWGTTSALGNGTGWEAYPSLQHTTTLTGLARFKSYHYRIVGADAAGQMQYTGGSSARTKLWWLFGK